MPDPAVYRLCADFGKPQKPEGWREYNLTIPPIAYFERQDSLAAIYIGGGVTIVHKMSVDDYHVQAVLSEEITDLDADVIQEMVDEIRPRAKQQLPRPRKRPRNAKGQFLSDQEE